MRPRTRLEPSHPDFPHGTDKGYYWGCRKSLGVTCPAAPTCNERHSAQKKREEATRAGHLPPGPAHRIDSTKVRQHIEHLLSLPAVTAEAVGRVSGLSAQTVLRARKRQQVERRVAAVILRVTTDQALAARRLIPAVPYAAKVRSMMALGYPMEWQVKQVGYENRSAFGFVTTHVSKRPTVSRALAERVDEIAERVGDRAATPENTGLPQWIIDRTRREAAERGYYPPAAYDEDGRLDPRALPGHPWHEADVYAELVLDILRTSTTRDPAPANAVAARLGTYEEHVQRVRNRAGLRYHEYTKGDPLTLRATSRPAQARVRAALDAYDYDGLDPVHAAARTGVWAMKPRQVPYDHPGWLSWCEERDRADEQARTVESAA